MNKVVSVVNMKGGVGKTTLSINLASALGNKAKILIVDLDPQANASVYLMGGSNYIQYGSQENPDDRLKNDGTKE